MDLYKALLNFVGREVQIRVFTEAGVVVSYVSISDVEDDMDKYFLYDCKSRVIMMIKKNRPYRIINEHPLLELNLDNSISIGGFDFD